MFSPFHEWSGAFFIMLACHAIRINNKNTHNFQTWFLVLHGWSLIQCLIFSYINRVIRNWFKGTRHHPIIWSRPGSRQRNRENVTRFYFFPETQDAWNVKEKDHSQVQDVTRASSLWVECLVEVESSLNSQVHVKFLPNKQKEGRANTFI